MTPVASRIPRILSSVNINNFRSIAPPRSVRENDENLCTGAPMVDPLVTLTKPVEPLLTMGPGRRLT